MRGECDQSDRCNIREPLRRVSHSIEEVLRRITILEMKEEAAEIGRQACKTASGASKDSVNDL